MNLPMWPMARLTAFSALLVVLSIAARGDDAPPKIGSTAPSFAAQDQEGRNVSLSDFTGKVLVLEWYDPDCEYTKRHAAARTMKTLADKYKEKGVAWLGVNSTHDGTPDRNREWVRQNDLPYPVLDDARKALAKQYGVSTVPFAVILDKTGRVAYVGGIDDDEDRSARPKEGRINYLDRALAEMTSGNQVTMPQGRVYGCPLK